MNAVCLWQNSGVRMNAEKAPTTFPDKKPEPARPQKTRDPLSKRTATILGYRKP